METETFLVLITANYSARRKKLMDAFSTRVWESEEHFLEKFCFNEDEPMGEEEVRFISVDEFVDWWNDQDDHTEEFDKMTPTDSWMGYIQVKVQ